MLISKRILELTRTSHELHIGFLKDILAADNTSKKAELIIEDIMMLQRCISDIDLELLKIDFKPAEYYE